MEQNNYLEKLTPEIICNEKIPINDILKDSFYYPSSAFDGGIVKDCNIIGRSYGISSFIYCDYAVGEEAFDCEKENFVGYHVLGIRKVNPHELIPNGWSQRLPPGVNSRDYGNYKDMWRPFMQWVVYERDACRDESHGLKRFSLLYIGGEGVATYQALYWSNRQRPKAMAIIQPGTGFGLNWTDFREQGNPLNWVVKNNPAGMPELVYYGGYGTGYDDFSWDEYEPERKIIPYYSEGRGEVQILKKKAL
jgi:hypothetical protein